METWDLTCLLLGLSFRIRCDHPETGKRVHQLLEALESSAQTVDPGRDYVLRAVNGRFDLVNGGECLYTAGSWHDLVTFLLTEMNRVALANFGGLACHAGVVATGGKAVAFPASARAGKTTLTSACVLGGWDYVSDEALCLDFVDANVTPYPRPLELSAWSRELLHIRLPVDIPGVEDAFVSVGEIGGRVPTGAVELAHVVSTAIDSGPPTLRKLPSSAVVTTLLRHSFNHYKNPLQSFRLTSRLAERCHAWHLSYSLATDAAALLSDELVQ